MESETRLDSAVFQLTPTRTRYGLVINADRSTERIASGLLDPFLAHLKEARDQVARGGYSIVLMPNPPSNRNWFTKGTMERFVRFVNTPEVLERVNTLESEGLQIEKAIAIQNNDNIGLSTVKEHQKRVKDYRMRSLETTEGINSSINIDAQKAVLICEYVAHQPEFNGSTKQEKNSKVQFLRVLETRKTLLLKEQDMAFARAVAAGFDMNHMIHLISFAESFGASRLIEACLGFMLLWKVKHEDCQWLESEVARSMYMPRDFSTRNAPDILLSERKLHKQFKEQLEINGKFGMDSKATDVDNRVTSFDKKGDRKCPPSQQELCQGQFQQPRFCQWPIHSPVDACPAIQVYPIQGMPCHQNHLKGLPYSYPLYSQIENPLFKVTQTIGIKRLSMDSKEVNTEAETGVMGVSIRLREGSEHKMECSQDREQRRKSVRSGKKQSSIVVIHNMNYIASEKRNNVSDGELRSALVSETNMKAKDGKDNVQEKLQKKSMRSSKFKGSHARPTNTWTSHDKNSTLHGQEEGGGNWKAFQHCLLRHNNDDKLSIVEGSFALEKEVQITRQQNKGLYRIDLHGQDPVIVQDRRIYDFQRVSENKYHPLKASNDELPSQVEFNSGSKNGHVGVQLKKVERGRGPTKETSDSFMVCNQKSQINFMSSNSETPSGHGMECATINLDTLPLHDHTDESFIVPIRLSSEDQAEYDRRSADDMSAALPSGISKMHDFSSRARRQLSYDADDLKLRPMRGTEKKSIGYAAASNYEMQLLSGEAVAVPSKQAVDGVTGFKEGLKNSNSMHENPEKRKMRPSMKKGESLKSNVSNEAQEHTEKLRPSNIDIQKMKKMREEEEVKRLEALKRERQRRITARSSSGPAQPTFASQTRPQVHTKISPVSYRGSKFSDSEPEKWSPLRRWPIKTTSPGSNVTNNITRPSSLNNSGQVAIITRSSRSAPSLSELKENGPMTPEPVITEARLQRRSETKMNSKPHIVSTKLRSVESIKLETKVAMDQVRKTSDPKTNNKYQASSINSLNLAPLPKPKLFDGPEVKKIPVVMNHDRRKAANLPVLKTRSLKNQLDAISTKMLMEEPLQKASGRPAENLKLNEVQRCENNSDDTNGEDKEVIEKTVVLESEIPPVPILQVSAERMGTRNNEYKDGEKNELVTEYAVPLVPPSPLIMGENVVGPSIRQSALKPYSKVIVDDIIEELPKIPSMDLPTKKDHSHARLSSLGETFSEKLESAKAPPKRSQMAMKSLGTGKSNVSDPSGVSSSEVIPGAPKKSLGRESLNGFKRFFKFGMKNHNTPADIHKTKSNRMSIDNLKIDKSAANTASSNEDHSLKFLLSQGETLTSGTPQKASRPFSLLSPFRRKIAKKLMK